MAAWPVSTHAPGRHHTAASRSSTTAVALARSSSGCTALLGSASATRHQRPHGGPRAHARTCSRIGIAARARRRVARLLRYSRSPTHDRPRRLRSHALESRHPDILMPSALARSIGSRQHSAPLAGGGRRLSRHPDAAGQPRANRNRAHQTRNAVPDGCLRRAPPQALRLCLGGSRQPNHRRLNRGQQYLVGTVDK